MENSMIHRIESTVEESLMQFNPDANISKSERYLSLGTGVFIALKGITNIFSHPLLALTELGIGSLLLYRSTTGYCPVKEMLEDKPESVPIEMINPDDAY